LAQNKDAYRSNAGEMPHAGKNEAFDCGVPPHLLDAASDYISAMEEARSAMARAAFFHLVRCFAS
jgi:hypothetical protein